MLGATIRFIPRTAKLIQMRELHLASFLGRREFLLASTGVAAGVMGYPLADAGDASDLLLATGGRELFRVRVEMELEGNVNVPKNALVSRESAISLPIKSQAKLDYEERFRRPPGVDSGEVTTVERFYHEASSSSRLGRHEHSVQLRDSVRETVVRRETLPEVIYSPEDYFQRDELELLRLPVSSAAVDQLLPAERVRVGSEYSPSRESIASVLNLTSVEASDVTAELVAITDQEAKIQFRGNVQGSVEGVPTELRTIGKLTFDRQIGICTWLAIAIHETREIGVAEPGFDIAATVKMVRQPLDRPVALASPPRSVDVVSAIPEDRLYSELASEELGFSTLMDRRWRMMRSVPGAAMMRMVDYDQSVAQCDLRSLPSLNQGAQWTLEAFQQDVKRTLGEQLSDLIEAEQYLSSAGLRVLRVVAQGSVQGLSIQWVMLHLSDDTGRRLLATFTMEGGQVATFAGADMQMAATLRFHRADTQPAGAADERPPSSGDKEVARANQGGDADHEVQSASDLR